MPSRSKMITCIGCGEIKLSHAKRRCRSCYFKMKRGNVSANKKLDYLKSIRYSKTTECIIHPFPKSSRLDFEYKGKRYNATRVMCQWKNGKPPSPDHHAAHECGNGDLGCINPNHLTWKTPLENNYDKIKYNTWGYKLSRDDVKIIRSYRGVLSVKEIAKTFNITRQHVYQIFSRKSWVV